MTVNDVFCYSADQCEKSENEPSKALNENQDKAAILPKSSQDAELIVKGTAIALKVCYIYCST